MTRAIINDNFGGQRLQSAARPIAPTGIAPAPAQDTRWQSLANAFAQGELLADRLAERDAEEQRENAARYANSMTVEELGKSIREGKLLPSQSPVFAAHVQHIWGANTQAQMERDTISKVTTGELKFGSPQEVDNWLTENRNTLLSGASKYAAAGFDKSGAAFRAKLMDAVAKNADKDIVAQAEAQGNDYLSNKLLEVTGPDFKGTPQEAAQALMGQYQLMRKTRVMSDGSARTALQETITRMAASGRTGLLEAMLAEELPGIGSVRSFLGEAKAATLVNQATSVYDQGQRQRMDDEVLPFYRAADTGTLNVVKFREWAGAEGNKKYITAATIHAIERANLNAIAAGQRDLVKSQMQGQALASEYEAKKRVEAAISNGTLWEVQGTNNPKVFTSSGDVKDFNVKDYAEQALKVKTANLPFDQQVSSWAMNGLDNPDWRAQLQAGFYNLSSIGVDSSGKPQGALNEAGRRAIELFRQLDAVNPEAAKQAAGEGAYKRFSDIGFLMHLGRDVSDAASIASNAATTAVAGSPADKLEKSIRAKVAEMTDTSWMDWLANKGNAGLTFGRDVISLPGAIADGFRRAWSGEGPAASPPSLQMRNTIPNTAQVHGWVKRYATLLAHSGQVGDAEAALKVAAEYISNPQVSAKINGTLYLRSELPAAPSAMRTPDEWLERFIDEVPKARAKELGFAGAEVRVEYDERANLYRAFAGGIPLTDPTGSILMWPKGSIQQWYSVRERQDILEAVAKRTKAAESASPGGTIQGVPVRQYNRAAQHLAPRE